MQLFRDLKEKILSSLPAVVSIGTFDGMHIGHQALIKYLHDITPFHKKVLITFQTHPSKAFNKNANLPQLIGFDQKFYYLEQLGIDYLYNIPFNSSLYELSAYDFLSLIKTSTNFDHLVLGYDSKFGKNKEGTPEKIKAISQQLNFKSVYFPPFSIQGLTPSSTLIRSLIKKGDLPTATLLLGRPITYFLPVTKGKSIGKSIGYPTLNFNLAPFSIPPLGVYLVQLKLRSKTYPAIANIGTAPTIKKLSRAIMEVYLLDNCPLDIEKTQKHLSVELIKFIRAEKKFSSIEGLRKQIKKDVTQAHIFFNTKILL